MNCNENLIFFVILFSFAEVNDLNKYFFAVSAMLVLPQEYESTLLYTFLKGNRDFFRISELFVLLCRSLHYFSVSSSHTIFER